MVMARQDKVPDPELIAGLTKAISVSRQAGVPDREVAEAEENLALAKKREETRQLLRTAPMDQSTVARLLEKARALGVSHIDPAVLDAELLLAQAEAVGKRIKDEDRACQNTGRRLLKGRFEVIQVVGEGAYGVVMKCNNRETGEVVAIKEFKISADEPDVEEVRRTSRREVAVLKSLRNRNVVKYLGGFYIADKMYVLMEFVPRNLLEILEEQANGLDRTFIKRCIYQLCVAITFIHSNGFIYRDIKPENLLIDNTGKLKLCDFGFARRMEGEVSDELTDYVATRWYRAPELLLGPPFTGANGKLVRSPYGKAVDMWAIGCLMGELIDGEPLFAGGSDLDQLHKIQKMQGRVTRDQEALFRSNPNNAGIVFDGIDRPKGLRNRYSHRVNDVELDFLEQLLRVDPAVRLTGPASLKHRYFAELAGSNYQLDND